MIQYRRKWEDGLTSKGLLDLVKKSLRKGFPKKANKLNISSIYNGVSQINILHYPPFYISCQGRLISLRKYEHRYFVPYTPEDIEIEKGKQIRLGDTKYKKAENAEAFGEEIEKEKQKVKVFQEIRNRK